MEQISDQKVPPRETWSKLSIAELFEVKSKLFDVYYQARLANQSYADQYLNFISYAETLIQQKTFEQEQAAAT